MKLKVETIGDEIGVILPEDLVARLNLGRDGSLLAAELVDGGLHVKPYDSAFEQAMAGVDDGAGTVRPSET